MTETMITLGSSVYPVVLREETRKNGVRCVIAEDPRVPGAVGYGDDEADAREMLDIVRTDILGNAVRASVAVHLPSIGVRVVVADVQTPGWNVTWAVPHAPLLAR